MRLDRLTLRLLLAQSADVITFLAFYVVIGASSGHQERNPFINLLMAIGGLHLVAIVKWGITGLVIRRYNQPIVSLRHRWYLPLRTIAISTATASGIVGAGFNIAAIIHSNIV